MRRRIIRLDADTLTRQAINEANAAQRATLETCLGNGFKVLKIVSNHTAIAVNVAAKDLSCWITPDGKLHRPVRGKRGVSIDTRTLERIW